MQGEQMNYQSNGNTEGGRVMKETHSELLPHAAYHLNTSLAFLSNQNPPVT